MSKVYTHKGDPYEYRRVGSEWETRKKGSDKWLSLKGNTKANDILNKRHGAPTKGAGPATRSSDTRPKPAELAPRTGLHPKSNIKIDGTRARSIIEKAKNYLGEVTDKAEEVAGELKERNQAHKAAVSRMNESERGARNSARRSRTQGRTPVLGNALSSTGIVTAEKVQFGRDLLGKENKVTEKSLTDSQMKLLRAVAVNAMKDGRNYILYKDYPSGADGVKEHSENGKESEKFWNTSDEMVVKRLLGRARVEMNNDAQLVVKDRYNFNEQESDPSSKEEMLSEVRDKGNSKYNRVRALGEYYGSDEGQGSEIAINLGHHDATWGFGGAGASWGPSKDKQQQKDNTAMKRTDYLTKFGKNSKFLQEGGPMPAPEAAPAPAGGGGGLEAAIAQVVQTQDPQLALEVCNQIAQSMGIAPGGAAPAPGPGPEGAPPAESMPAGPPMGRYGMKIPAVSVKK